MGILGSVFAAFLGSVVVARALSPAERGHYATVMVLTALLIVFTELGGDIGVLRALTEADTPTLDYLRGYLTWALVTSLAGGSLVLTIAYLIPQSKSRAVLLALTVALALAGSVVSRFTTGILLFDNHLTRLAVVRAVAGSGALVGCGGVIVLGLVDSPSGWVLAAATYAAQFTMNAASAFIVSTRDGVRLLPGPPATLRLLWSRRNVTLHALNCSTFLLSRADQLALALFGMSSTLGQYAVATNVSEVAGYGQTALSPLLAQGHPGRTPQSVQRLALLVIGASVVIAPLAYLALPVIYGERYQAGAQAAFILVPATALFSVGRMYQSLSLRSVPLRLRLTLLGGAVAGLEFTLVAAVGRRGVIVVAACSMFAYAIFLVGNLTARRRAIAIGPSTEAPHAPSE